MSPHRRRGASYLGGIVVDPIESGALGGVIEEAGKQGIKVAVLDPRITPMLSSPTSAFRSSTPRASSMFFFMVICG